VEPNTDIAKFATFLRENLDLADCEVPSPGEWAGTGNTLGSIGLRLGLLSLDQIDKIVNRQASDSRLFGQIGISQKFLTEEDVERLLELQRFHRCLDLGALLVIERQITFPDLLNLIAEFFRANSRVR
jgi:hypothetical protein